MRKRILFSVQLCICFYFSIAQNLDNSFKEAAVKQLADQLKTHYIFPDIAGKIEEHLVKQFNSGYFNRYNDIDSFAAALTNEARAINNDQHISVATNRQPGRQRGNQLTNQILNLNSMQRGLFGFKEVKRLEGNIGYLNIERFPSLTDGKAIADHYMSLLNGADAIIIDMRKNGGGDPEMVRYICSFFLDKKTHLNSIYWRQGNFTKELWSFENVDAEKMPDVPLFILTSSFTFSGGEEFCYDLQALKRVTIIGETTGGGANPGQVFPLNASLLAFIPTGRAINPVTKTNWEGVGINPDIKVTSDKAFETALVSATAAAETYRQSTAQKINSWMQHMDSLLSNLSNVHQEAEQKKIENAIWAQFKSAIDNGYIGEGAINLLGYSYLQKNNIAAAQCVLRDNTLLYPNSANVFDSYGEVLEKDNKFSLAKNNYQKAVDIAQKTNHPLLENFRNNLNRVSKQH